MTKSNSRENIAEQLRESIETSNRLHSDLSNNPDFLYHYDFFSTWQRNHVWSYFDDILADRKLKTAMEFMLNNLVGTSIIERDRDIQRVIPIAVKTLPLEGLKAIADALRLSAHTLDVDIKVCKELVFTMEENSEISEYDFCVASRNATAHESRLMIINEGLVAGQKLEDLMKVPLIGLTMKAIRKPAKLAGFESLHRYLHAGYDGFRKVPDIPNFLNQVDFRLKAIFTRIYKTPLKELS